MVYNYEGLDDKELPVRYISGDVEPILRDLVQASIESAYDDPIGFFEEQYSEMAAWEKLMRKACEQLGLNYDDIVAERTEFERVRFEGLGKN
jgi:hypothetical protein